MKIKEKGLQIVKGVKENKKKIAVVASAVLLLIGGIGTACYANYNDVETLEISNSGKQLAMYCGEVGSAESKLKSLGVELAADSEEENTDTEVADTEVEATEEQTEENVTVADSVTSSSISNSSTSSSKSSGSTKSSTASTASTTSTHTHSWQPVYTTTTVVDKQATTTQKAIYELEPHYYCTLCWAEITDTFLSGSTHYKETGCMGGYTTGNKNVLVGYETIYTPAETHTEQKLIGYKCSCGATK